MIAFEGHGRRGAHCSNRWTLARLFSGWLAEVARGWSRSSCAQLGIEGLTDRQENRLRVYILGGYWPQRAPGFFWICRG